MEPTKGNDRKAELSTNEILSDKPLPDDVAGIVSEFDFKSGSFEFGGGVALKYGEDDTMMMANFAARITKEVRFVDGKKTSTELHIEGVSRSGKRFTTAIIPAEKFQAMGWVMSEWGVQAVITPGGSIKDELRTLIQYASHDAEVVTIYTHTGWIDIKGTPHYLSSNGAIGPDGLNTDIKINLPHDLQKYDLVNPVDDNTTQAVHASLALLNIAPKQTTWPLLAALYGAAIREIDFAMHVTGRTGTYKSEITSLIQSHHGEMDARSLPASWSSTANALEALAYRAKNALMVVDDFVPIGTSWQVKTYQAKADQLIRGQGNQAGRQRLTDTSNLQNTMYPRGILLSTGEDTPEGHSVRGRCFIMELTPGEISIPQLSTSQDNRHLLPLAFSAYIHWIAKNYARVQDMTKGLTAAYRDSHISVGHSRTPTTIGRLMAAAEVFLTFAAEEKHITDSQAKTHLDEAHAAILKTGDQQQSYITDADPAQIFVQTVQSVMAAGKCHCRNREGGIPSKPLSLGWTEGKRAHDDFATYKANGPTLGWTDWNTGTLYLDANLAYEFIKKHSGGQLALTKATLFKRLKEGGVLTQTDTKRQRNTVRVQCHGSGKNCLVLSLYEVLELQEEQPNE